MTLEMPELEPSITPINDRLKKAYIDKFNSLMVSGMSQEQVQQHIADQEDYIKVIQTQLQATLDVDEEMGRSITTQERERLRAKDREYRAKARPTLNPDGTRKTPRVAKAQPIGDSGTQAFENLVDKLVVGGLTRENAIKLLKSGGK